MVYVVVFLPIYRAFLPLQYLWVFGPDAFFAVYWWQFYSWRWFFNFYFTWLFSNVSGWLLLTVRDSATVLQSFLFLRRGRRRLYGNDLEETNGFLAVCLLDEIFIVIIEAMAMVCLFTRLHIKLIIQRREVKEGGVLMIWNRSLDSLKILHVGLAGETQEASGATREFEAAAGQRNGGWR